MRCPNASVRPGCGAYPFRCLRDAQRLPRSGILACPHRAAAPSAAAARLSAPSSPRTKAVIYHELPLQSAQDCLALVAQWASVRIGAVMSPVRIPLVASFAERRGARARVRGCANAPTADSRQPPAASRQPPRRARTLFCPSIRASPPDRPPSAHRRRSRWRQRPEVERVHRPFFWRGTSRTHVLARRLEHVVHQRDRLLREGDQLAVQVGVGRVHVPAAKSGGAAVGKPRV